MLNIRANIGDVVVVTFVNGKRDLQSQERIRFRRGFLDSNGPRVGLGDRCKVRIVGANPAKTAFFLRVESVIRPGDGAPTRLERVIAASKWYQDNESALATARNLSAGGFDLLDLLIDVLDYYRFNGRSGLPDRAPLIREVLELIDRSSQEKKAAGRCLYLAAMLADSNRKSALTCLQRGLALASAHRLPSLTSKLAGLHDQLSSKPAFERTI